MIISRIFRVSIPLLSLALAASLASPSTDARREGKGSAAKTAAGDAGGRAPVGEIRAGQPVTGTLAGGDSILEDDGSYVDVWRYAGRAGERVTVSMSSKRFDTYLMFTIGGQSIASNDDAPGGGTNSRLSVVLPVDGWYTVDANALKAGDKGAYTLSIRSEPARPPARDWALDYPGGGDPRERYAVIVGVDRYPESLSADLEGPAADARLMRSVLVEKYGFRPENVLLLLDGAATRDRILAAAERHLGQAGPDGVAVLYYSGHGTRLDDNFGAADREPDGKDEALLVWGPEHGSVILDDELTALSDRLRAGRALFVLDACHSGSASRPGAAADPEEAAKRLVEFAPAARTVEGAEGWVARGGDAARRRIVLTASRDDEVSWISADPWPGSGVNESVFTHYLVEQLRAAGERETFQSVMRRVQVSTARYTKTTHGKVQTPQLDGARPDDTIWDFLRKR